MAVGRGSRAGPLTIAFTTSGGFALFVELDRSTFLPKAYSYVGNLAEGECGEPPVISAATRRVSFDDYREIDGIRFPAKMTETISTEDGRALLFSMQFTSIRVNAGINDADFEK
jgi:hypothetical protein